MQYFYLIIILVSTVACQPTPTISTEEKLNNAAIEYVKLGLAIGEYDAAFIDAYYGPDTLNPKRPKLNDFPKESFLLSITKLYHQIDSMRLSTENNAIIDRAEFLLAQLNAFEMRIKIFSGETPSFDEETEALFGVTAPTYSMEHFDEVLASLDKSLPGSGTIAERYQAIIDKFKIPMEKFDTICKAAIEESKNRTLKYITLPQEETFTFELVQNKSWGGYNWYQGNYSSLIQINTDLPQYFMSAIDVGSHESYPGHHVYNMLLEKDLYNGKGWVETSMYPLFSPQSLIAEGTANFGIEMIFPGEEKANFCKEVLLPLAGMDTMGISNYFNVIKLSSELSYVNNEVGRKFINGNINEEEAVKLLMKYGLRTQESAEKFLSFIKTYRSYIINYNYGKDLVKNFVESNGGTSEYPEKRWELFTWLLSNQILPTELMIEN